MSFLKIPPRTKYTNKNAPSVYKINNFISVSLISYRYTPAITAQNKPDDINKIFTGFPVSLSRSGKKEPKSPAIKTIGANQNDINARNNEKTVQEKPANIPNAMCALNPAIEQFKD